MTLTMRTVKHLWLIVFLCFLLNPMADAQNSRRQSKGTQIITFKKGEQSDSHNAENVLLKHFIEADNQPELTLQSVKKEDQLGIQHRRYQATYQQLPIEFGDYTVHEKEGKVYSISGEHLSLNGINTTPSVSPNTCLAAVLDHLKAEQYLWETDNPDAIVEGYKKPSGELMILPAIKGLNPKDQLVYKFTIIATKPMYAGDFYVSAHTGQIVFENSQMCHASVPASGDAVYDGPVSFTAETYNTEYRLVNPNITTGGLFTLQFNLASNNTGYYLSNETSPTTTFQDDVAVQAHWSGEKTIEYFQQTHNWDSYDGNGSKISIVTDAQNYQGNNSNTNNAYWIINRAWLGKGDGTNYNNFAALDVVGHEITHGVIQNTANLIYQNESGALNESFADIFGESIELFATNNQDWLIGEDIKPGVNTALRSFSNPNTYGHPDTYAGQNYYTGPFDNGGVHTNSSVQNYWFYLLSTGGTGTNDHGDNYSVDAIGIEKAQAIAFRNLSVYLTANSTFWDARLGAIQSAIDLYGAGSLEEISVTNAWYAVGVGTYYNNPNPPTCASGAVVLTINFDNNPERIAWNLFNNATWNPVVFKAPGSYTASQANTQITETLNITQSGKYKFNIYDLNRDGLCCSSGNGSYQITAGGTVIASGDIFDLSDTRQLCIDFPTGPDADLIRPTIPTNLAASNVTSNSADLTWDASTDNSVVTNYLVFYNDDFIGAGPTGSPYTLNGLTPNTTYDLEVYAVDNFGNYSEKGNTVTITTPSQGDITPPSVPTNLAVNNITSSGFDLTWDASTDNVGVASYDVYLDGNFYANTSSTNLNLTGLNSNTTYACFVEAIDINNNVSASSSSINATTLSVCGQGALSLRITFDNNPQAIAWQIKDNQQNILAGNFYSLNNNLSAGDVLVENIPTLPAGDYALVVFDASGDGLCCMSGNGSFELFDNQNTILSGDIFEFSSVQTFCVGNTNNDVFDLTPPTTSVLTASNPTASTIDLSWTASTDNDVLMGYVIFMDGVYIGDIPTGMTSITVPNLSSNTTYDFFLAARDLTGNFSAKSNTATETTTGGVVASIIHEGYFETGWDGWIDGGNDCYRHNKPNRAFEGNYAIRLRDDSGVNSSMTSPTFDLSTADSVNITFQYHTRGFENGEDFFIKFKQNSSYVNVAQFVKGTDFTANGFYEATVTIDANAYTFGTTDQFRIQTDASDNTDKIWVDQVIITAYSVGGASALAQPEVAIGNKEFFVPEKTENSFTNHDWVDLSALPTAIQNKVGAYPNPAQFEISLRGIDTEKVEMIQIYDNYGRLMMTTTETQNIDIDQLSNGIHHLIIVNKNRKNQSIKFVKDDLR